MGYWILHSTGTSKADPSLVFMMGDGGESSIMEPMPLPCGSICGAWYR